MESNSFLWQKLAAQKPSEMSIPLKNHFDIYIYAELLSGSSIIQRARKQDAFEEVDGPLCRLYRCQSKCVTCLPFGWKDMTATATEKKIGKIWIAKIAIAGLYVSHGHTSHEWTHKQIGWQWNWKDRAESEATNARFALCKFRKIQTKSERQQEHVPNNIASIP